MNSKNNGFAFFIMGLIFLTLTGAGIIAMFQISNANSTSYQSIDNSIPINRVPTPIGNVQDTSFVLNTSGDVSVSLKPKEYAVMYIPDGSEFYIPDSQGQIWNGYSIQVIQNPLTARNLTVWLRTNSHITVEFFNDESSAKARVIQVAQGIAKLASERPNMNWGYIKIGKAESGGEDEVFTWMQSLQAQQLVGLIGNNNLSQN